MNHEDVIALIAMLDSVRLMILLGNITNFIMLLAVVLAIRWGEE